MAEGVVTLRISGGEPGDLDARLRSSAPDHASRVVRLTQELSKLLVRAGKIYLRVDSSTPAAATAVVNVTQSAATAGDTLRVTVPGYQSVVLTAVASGADPEAGEFDIGASDTAMGDNLAATINAVKGLKNLLTASANAGAVTLTSGILGSFGNGITLTATVDAGTPFGTVPSFSGGTDVLPTPTLTATVTQANLVSGTDTLNIGTVALAAQTSPSGENQWAIGADDQAAGENLAAAINGHSKLEGLVSATDDGAGVVTISYLGAGRDAALLLFSEAGNGIVLSATSFTLGTTEAYEGDGSLV